VALVDNIILSSLDELIRKQPIDGTIGGIRAKKVRRLYGLERISNVNVLTKTFNLKELEEISEICETWRTETEIMPFKKVYLEQEIRYIPDLYTTSEKYHKFLDKNNIKHSIYNDYVFLNVEKWEYDYKICCKRGNSVYLNMVRDKFKPLEKWSQTEEAKKRLGFSTIVNENRKRIRKGKLFFITLTLDHNKIKTVGESWLKSGRYLNSYLTYLRQEFPGIVFFCAPQAQANGYFHPHILAYLPNQSLTVYPHKEFNEKKNKTEYIWRIHNRQKHNGKLALDIFKSWKYGFSDVRAVDDLKKGLTEVLKYVTRELKGGEYNLTMGALWFFGKQGYSMSKKFMQSVTGMSTKELIEKFGDIVLAEPNNDNLINDEVVIQSNNSKSNLIRLEFFPPILKMNLDFSQQLKVDDIENVPDPPPNVVRYFEKMEFNCVPTIFKKKQLENGSVIDIVVYKWKD